MVSADARVNILRAAEQDVLVSGLHDERRVGVQHENPPCPHEHLPHDTNGLQWMKGNKGCPKPSERLFQREDAAKEHMGAVRPSGSNCPCRGTTKTSIYEIFQRA